LKLPAYEFDPIAFLVSRRFPVNWKGQTPSRENFELVKPTLELLDELNKFKTELLQKTPKQIEALVSEERAKIASEEEAKKWYNSPAVAADFEHWSKTAFWTIDEGVALTFGKSPDKITWDKIKSYVNVSKFARDFELCRDLALRAKALNQLASSNLPGFFLAWAKKLDITYPVELEDAVVARGNWIGDWQASYEREVKNHAATVERAKAEIAKTLQLAQESHDKALEIGKKAVAERDALIADLTSQIASLETQLDEAKAKKPAADKKPLDLRERESLLKLVIGMASCGYNYRPNAVRNTATSEIATDLEICGVGLDEDTVRKYLQEAKELLPPPETE
jgi:hypothetical protein